MRILYFSWLRERIGKSEESIDNPPAKVEQLIDMLAAKNPQYAAAFADKMRIRVALDQRLATLDSSLSGVSEVALFPPMTGG